MAMARGNTAVDERVLRRSYFEWLLANGIRTDEELLDFIEIFFGYRLVNHRSPHCPHHDPPAKFVTDQFFDRINMCLGFASRLSGKTLEVAILNLCDMMFKPGCEVLSAGAIKDQAKNGYKYVIEGLTGMRDCLVGAGAPLQVASIGGEHVVLSNDSKATITTTTWTGLNSAHPSRVRIDEVELIDYRFLQEALSMSTSRGEVKAQDTFTSTRKVATGTMQKLLDNAGDLGVTVRAWCVWDVLETCTRKCKGDKVFGDCPVYSRRNIEGKEEYLCGIGDGRGKAQALPPGGWFTIADFVKKAQNCDREVFEAQWLCLRPNQLQVVYGMSYRDEPPFVLREEEELEILRRYRESPSSWARIYGQDFGANWGLCEFIRDPLTEIWYGVWEYFWDSSRERTTSAHAEYMKANDPLGFSVSDFVGYGDPAGRQLMQDLEEYDIFFVPANNALYEGVAYCKNLFERAQKQPDGLPGIRLFRQMRELRKELNQMYLHPQRKDGEVERDKFVKRANHMADGMRYALYSHHTIGTATYSVARLRGI